MKNRLNYLHENQEDFEYFLQTKKRYLFKRKQSKREKQRFELNALFNTLDRLLEDFILRDENIELIYLVDSSEFMGYVNPEANIENYVFKIEGLDLDPLLIRKKAKWRKYRYEVLFGMKSIETKGKISNIYHQRHFDEVVGYYHYLLANSLSSINTLNSYLFDVVSTDSAMMNTEEEIITSLKNMKEKGIYIDVFKELTQNRQFIERFNDLKNEGDFQDLNSFDWSAIGLSKEYHDDAMNGKYDDAFLEALNLSFIASDKSRKQTLRIDHEALAFVCSTNDRLIKSNSNYRIALLSSSKLLTNLTRYLLDFVSDKDDITKELTTYFNDVLYIRYPTFLINEIQNLQGTKNWKVRKLIKHELLPIIRSVLRKLQNKQKRLNIEPDLNLIARKWKELRDNFLIEENIEDFQLQKTENEIDFKAVYEIIFKDNERILDDFVDSYLYLKLENLSKGFKGQIKSFEKYKANGETRMFLKSDDSFTSQYVFQIPEIFLENKIITFSNESLIKIQKSRLALFRKSDRINYKFACILFAAVQKDWEIVKSISISFLKTYSEDPNCSKSLIEEIGYIYHLSLRYSLSDKVARYGFENLVHFDFFGYIDRINKELEKAIKLNENNPRLLLSQLSFKLEKYVLIDNYSKNYDGNKEIASTKEALFDGLQLEFTKSNFLENVEENFGLHCFSDNLFQMYYKVLLCFKIHCFIRDQNETTQDEEKSTELLGSLISINNKLNSAKLYNGTKFIIEATKQILHISKYDVNILENSCKDLPTHSFLRRFIARPFKNLVERLEKVNLESDKPKANLWGNNSD